MGVSHINKCNIPSDRPRETTLGIDITADMLKANDIGPSYAPVERLKSLRIDSARGMGYMNSDDQI